MNASKEEEKEFLRGFLMLLQKYVWEPNTYAAG